MNDVIHSDIKPANIMFSGGVAKIADFGLAKTTRYTYKIFRIRRGNFDSTGGTRTHMPPESFASAFGPKTDVWAFGVVLYEIFHNKHPWSNYRDY
jgi:serine/threonine protein kinase